jgi:maleate isomerase
VSDIGVCPGFDVVRSDDRKNVTDIYGETAERACRLARSVNAPEAAAVFLSGTGMSTLPASDMLETDLGKPVISSNLAMMRHAQRRAGARQPIPGYRRVLTLGLMHGLDH